MAGVSHGTYFAFYLSDSYLAIAIESRRKFDTPDGKTIFLMTNAKFFLLAAKQYLSPKASYPIPTLARLFLMDFLSRWNRMWRRPQKTTC